MASSVFLSWTGVTSTFIAVGATPATAGSVRLTNGEGIFSRNSANNADKLIAGYGTSIADTISIGQTGTDVSMPGGVGIGATPGADGNCNAATFSVAGAAGVDFGPAGIASITIVKGIVTAAS